MPDINWGLARGTVTNFDRTSQYTPYTGPIPPDGVFMFRVKNIRYAAPTNDKLPQMQPGLELVPRTDEEVEYAGYFLRGYLPVSERTGFRYVPFLDAIGVSESAFLRAKRDNDGNITRMGKWTPKAETLILVQIRTTENQKGEMFKEMAGWCGVPTDAMLRAADNIKHGAAHDDDDDIADDDSDYADEFTDEDDYDEDDYLDD